MEISKLSKATQYQANILFNSVAQGEVVHRKLNEARFEEQFITESENVKKINLIASEGESVIGFANASYKVDTNIAYITFIVVKKEYRRNGIGRKLLKALETELDQIAVSPLPKYDITFFNPINLEWCVPNTKEHDHPNAPGVDVSGSGYLFLKNCGYRDTVYQNSFYQPLASFEFSSQIKERLESLKEQDITITYYNKEKHYGLDELFTDLGNEQWREIIIGNVNKPDGGYPVLIAEHKGKAVGFTGPLYVQPSGRGYFAGIGVHSEYRKYGLGKALFSSLCMSLKEMGAGYMTLFTGETNPARNIYEGAGFKIVKTWADMERVKR
ncbi:GNAT family N-acetyltransferase [Paludicola sp. MB14-C6]|uniref:GNAT family N-acetyltransferase n=1 Tax=Paludihabitans sp. MB14-C6 TaxID=3070656 RepID=UPI0027DD0BB3|nr:GNAT family N-acetyltransferase [Paludicola sp. MB14-C6]WMJ24387.1 GNAT family N-acetyltransferase [Paludicola sp. MB14-C6]